MDRGLFISLEGPDGSGKSTQAKLLMAFLSEAGYRALLTREPGGTAIGEKIRELLLDKRYSEMDSRAEALLYAAARAQLVTEVIEPALERGEIVICDRFVDSSTAYQGYGRKLGGSIGILNEFAVAGCMPDITFLFIIDPETGKSRIRAANMDRLECERTEFHEDVYRGYRELEKLYPGRIAGIDASGGIDEIQSKVRERLKEILKGRHDV